MPNAALAYGKQSNCQELGKLVREKRKQEGITQAELAAIAFVGIRFISELENGKPSVQLGKTIQVLEKLGLEIHILLRTIGLDYHE